MKKFRIRQWLKIQKNKVIIDINYDQVKRLGSKNLRKIAVLSKKPIRVNTQNNNDFMKAVNGSFFEGFQTKNKKNDRKLVIYDEAHMFFENTDRKNS